MEMLWSTIFRATGSMTGNSFSPVETFVAGKQQKECGRVGGRKAE